MHGKPEENPERMNLDVEEVTEARGEEMWDVVKGEELRGIQRRPAIDEALVG